MDGINQNLTSTGIGGPPTLPPIVKTGGPDDNDGNPVKAQSNTQSETQPKPANKELNLLRQISNWTGLLITLPTGIAAGISGIGSFLKANTSAFQFEQMENFANYSTRLAYAGYGIGGLLTNIDSKNIFGTIGYGFCALVSPFAPQEIIYPLSGLSSGLDAMPLTIELLSKQHNEDSSPLLKNVREAVQKEYNPLNDSKYKLSEFSSWQDGLEKGLKTSWLSIKDIKSSFDYSKPIESISNILKRPDFNLISSTCGYLASFIFFCFTPFKFFGEICRDLFGFQSDVGVWQGGLNGTIDKPKPGMKFNKAGDWRKGGDIAYTVAGPPYTLGSIVDLIYRFTKKENLHLAALGFDRIGAACMAAGNIFHDAGTREESKTHTGYYTAA